ncbi:hypothetical protein MMC22_001566 [Lobaria immixta]|nr:hypothetical protein [Lobaria immixta]
MDLCASRLRHPGNMECTCLNENLVCGSAQQLIVQYLVNYCLANCNCGPRTRKNRDSSRLVTTRLNFPGVNPLGGWPKPITSPPTVRTCRKTCTGVIRDCDHFFDGGCNCYAPPTSSIFWFSGQCGPVHHLPKRDLAQNRHSYYLNATARYASPNDGTGPPGPPPDLAAQLASGLLPSPCNASYVSFACGDSVDGIVHEPPQKWLGALLPEDAKESLPPVPEEFLRINRENEDAGA